MAYKAKQSGAFRSRRQEDPPRKDPPKIARQVYTARPCLKKRKQQENMIYTDQCLVGHKNQSSDSQIILKGTQESKRTVPQKC